MKFPPKPKTPYTLDAKQEEIIFAKLALLEDKKLSPDDEQLIKFLYSQLEDDWQTPLENLVDELISERQTKIGIHESVVPQVLDGKTCTWRLRDHHLEAGDKVIFENSQTGEIFGQGEITKVEVTTIGKINLNDKTHYVTYKTRQELIEAFQRHYPDYDITESTPVYAYTYQFTPREKE
jgi:hypothetical protein